MIILKDYEKFFKKAYDYIKENHPDDLEWSERCLARSEDKLTKERFFIEYMFAVYVSGFRYQRIKERMDGFRKAYWDFNVDKISRRPDETYDRAIEVFGNKIKTRSIIKGAKIISDWTKEEFQNFLNRSYENIDTLTELPYIGPTLKYHMARAIGVDCIKPDVHLVRIGKNFGMDPFKMCEDLAEKFDLSLHKVDTVLWKYAEQGKFLEEGGTL